MEHFSKRGRDNNLAAYSILLRSTKVSRCTHYVYNDIDINISSLVSLLTYYSFSTLLFLRSGLSYQGNLSKHQSFDIITIRRLIIFIQTDPFMCVKNNVVHIYQYLKMLLNKCLIEIDHQANQMRNICQYHW